jgi:hypothetical protein
MGTEEYVAILENRRGLVVLESRNCLDPPLLWQEFVLSGWVSLLHFLPWDTVNETLKK